MDDDCFEYKQVTATTNKHCINFKQFLISVFHLPQLHVINLPCQISKTVSKNVIL